MTTTTGIKWADGESEQMAVDLRNHLNENTVVTNDGVCLRNFVANRPYIKRRAMHDYPASWRDGMPVVIVGAGPSYPKAEPTLKRWKNRHLFVTDRRLSRTVRAGLKPDAVFTLDPSPIVRKFLGYGMDKVDTSDITLVAATTANPLVIEAWEGPILWMNAYSSCPAGKYIYERARAFGCLSTAGNVGTWAMNYAVSIRADPVVLVGMDMSERMNAFNWPRGKPITFPYWSEHFRAEHNSDYTKEENTPDGSPYPTAYEALDSNWALCPQFVAYLQATFECFRQVKGLVQLVNCTEGGALYGDDVVKMRLNDFAKMSDCQMDSDVKAQAQSRAKDLLYHSTPALSDADVARLIRETDADKGFKETLKQWSQRSSTGGGRTLACQASEHGVPEKSEK
jgi:hypothetical protein